MNQELQTEGTITLQLKNFPQLLHRELKARAALEGKTITQLMIQIIRREGQQNWIASSRSGLKPSLG